MPSNTAAILVSWNSSEDLKTLIPFLATSQDFTKIIIVDNNSQDKSVAVVEKLQSQYDCIELIVNRKNLGFSGGVNRGIEYARNNNLDYFCLINCDITLQKNTISELKHFLDEKSEYGAVASILLNKDQSIQVYGGGKLNWNLGTSSSYKSGVNSIEFDYLSAACILIRTEITNEIGLFDDANFFMYWEDIDFSLRIKQSGWKLGVCITSKCVHEMSKSLGRFGEIKDYYTVVSLIRFFKKHKNTKSFITIHVAITLKIAKRFMALRFKNIFYIIKGYLDA